MRQGLHGRFGADTTDQADVYEQFPPGAGDKRSAVVTLRNPGGGEIYGVAPGAQLLGPTPAVFHYDWF